LQNAVIDLCFLSSFIIGEERLRFGSTTDLPIGLLLIGWQTRINFFDNPLCQIIKDQEKIKVGRFTMDIAGAPHAIYIKRYNAFSLRHRLASPFIHSGAFRALRGAAILRAASIPIAVPVAAVENRVGGAITKSFFIAEEIANGKTIDAYWRDELETLIGGDGVARRRGFLKGLAQLFS